MAVRIEETIVMTGDRDAHPDAAQVAAFVDRTADASVRRSIEAHLASCADCRAEVSDIVHIVAGARRRRNRPAWMAGVAAAAAIMLIAWPRGGDRSPAVHRERPVTTTIAPAAVQPVGTADSMPALLWTAVPHADRYRVRVFAADGSVVWERESADTILAVPASAGLRAGETYYWNVEAHIGFDRRVASELVGFSFRISR